MNGPAGTGPVPPDEPHVPPEPGRTTMRPTAPTSGYSPPAWIHGYNRRYTAPAAARAVRTLHGFRPASCSR